MSTDRETTRIVRSWLQTDEYESADRVIGVVLGRLDTTPQRVPWWRAWRDAFMTSTFKLATAALALVVVAGIGLAIYFSQATTTPGATQSAAPTIAPTTAPSTVSPSAPPLEGMIIFARRGGDFGEGRIFALNVGMDRPAIPPTNAAGEELFFDEEACCLVAVPDGPAALYGTLEGNRIIPTYVNEAYREELGWSELMLEAGYPVGNLNLAPRAATSPGDPVDEVYAMEGWDPDDGSHAGVYLSISNGGRLVSGTFEQLTSAPTGFRDVPVAFSPDGTRLLFSRLESSPEGDISGEGDLLVVDLEGGEPRRVNPSDVTVAFSDDFGAGASWSPDGSRIAFSGFSGAGEGESRVYVADGETEGVAISDPGQWITSARWSPTGEWILFDKVSESGSTHDLYIIAPDGGDERNLTSTYDGGTCCGQWSPDGQRIVAMGGETPATSNLTVFSLDGSEPVRITEDGPETYLWYSWTP